MNMLTKRFAGEPMVRTCVPRKLAGFPRSREFPLTLDFKIQI